MRIEVFYSDYLSDGRAKRLLKDLKSHISQKIENLVIIDVYICNFAGLSAEQARGIFCDPVAQTLAVDSPAYDKLNNFAWDYLIEISYKAGVTDPIAITAREAIESELSRSLPKESKTQTARQYLIQAKNLNDNELEKLRKNLYNGLIQRALLVPKHKINDSVIPEYYDNTVQASEMEILRYDIAGMNENELQSLSKERLLALSKQELVTIKNYYSSSKTIENRKKRGLSAEATDLELEMIAQTWSEHCKHKILNAEIIYSENDKEEKINSLFKTYIKKTTDMLRPNRPFLRSVFHDDSGVINFDEENEICFKVETHNSPSALDPYGGAITGIVGVNRDILGTGKGARPIFNTNYLCFADPDTSDDDVPEGLLPPRQVLSGVHRGIVDGGNQSGIPVVGGGFIFDESYLGKPLVFCGTGGILPHKINGEESWTAHVDPGDLAVMIGGRIGKDGIHGATFSSMALDEESPTSAVQIGDPITQKKMSDFLMEARDKGLYKGITDNGAGGLSSSLGEMAEASGGIRINLEKCPLKYDGLAPWEILVSESQERMSLAVDKLKVDEFMTLAESRGVEASVIGEFTDSGYMEAYYEDRAAGLLDLDFLHNGLPTIKLKGVWVDKNIEKPDPSKIKINEKEALCKLLAEPTISSKEELVRQYDHEVQAGSVIKPFCGIKRDGPSDGAVFRPKIESKKGITVTHGICPRISDYDTYAMAACAVDEAFRAHISLGGNPEKASALDNFCWPDPIPSEKNPDGEYKTAQLVRACQGLRDACLAYGLPLISGKDSMKNDAQLQGKKISVRPTLLISLMGIIDDVGKAMTSDFKNSGDLIYLLGKKGNRLGGSYYEKVCGVSFGNPPKPNFNEALELYKKLNKALQEEVISSCHDISDGGMAVCIVESMIGGKCGCSIDISCLTDTSSNPSSVLFNEEPSRFIVSISPERKNEFEQIFPDNMRVLLGSVSSSPKLSVGIGEKELFDLDLSKAEKLWKRL